MNQLYHKEMFRLNSTAISCGSSGLSGGPSIYPVTLATLTSGDEINLSCMASGGTRFPDGTTKQTLKCTSLGVLTGQSPTAQVTSHTQHVIGLIQLDESCSVCLYVFICVFIHLFDSQFELDPYDDNSE